MNNNWVFFFITVFVIVAGIIYANYKLSKVERDSNERILKILGYQLPKTATIIILALGLGFLFNNDSNDNI